MIILKDLKETTSIQPSGRDKKRSPSLDETKHLVKHHMDAVVDLIDEIQELLNKYPEIKDEPAENYWVHEIDCPCAMYQINGKKYDLFYQWIYFDQIEKTLKTLNVRPLRSIYTGLTGKLGLVRHSGSDDFGLIYQYNLAIERIVMVREDLELLRDTIIDRHTKKEGC